MNDPLRLVDKSFRRSKIMSNFIHCNPHPQGLRVGDCVKRAIVIASEINYHDIAIMLNRYKKITGTKKYNVGDNYKDFVEQVLLGRKNKGDMQHEFYGHRYTVSDWAKWWESDKSILRCSKHLVATKNGYYYDTWNSGEKGVYIAWFIPSYEKIVKNIKSNFPKLCKGLTLEKFIAKPYQEIEHPKEGIEYWVVLDESTEIPHYFLTKPEAQAFANENGHEIVFHECFN